MNPPSVQSTHIPILDHLRGLAALFVFFGHFGALLPVVVIGEAFVRLTSCGAYGVEMFFAISGFVIPYSMYTRGHTIRQSGTFLLRRMARLEPPYLACIALIICLNGVTAWRVGPGEVHPEVQITVPQLLAHLGYLNAILGYRWLNVVFWTLAIEFQFYLACVLAFPCISARRTPIRVFSLIAIALLGFLGTGTRVENPPLLLYWLPLFAMGMATYCYLTRQIDRKQSLAVFCIVIGTAIAVNGVISTAAAAIPLCAIAIVNYKEPWAVLRPLAWAGSISYSIYLLHLPIGLRMAGHLRQHAPPGPAWEIAIFASILLTVVGASVLFHRCIEKPAMNWSKRIGRRPQAALLPSEAMRPAAIPDAGCLMTARGLPEETVVGWPEQVS